MPHILLALSGGVDSSVAASLLLEQGHRLSGVFMRHALQVRKGDLQDAQKAAGHLGIPLHVLDIDEPFEDVVERFVDEYLAGTTPNPCAYCNRKIKFGLLLEFAETLGAEGFATGHYAKIQRLDQEKFGLFRAKDLSKDQSYLLYGIEKNRLRKIHFPLGNLLKSEVREKAIQLGLHVSGKKDSQEICFVQPHQHADFIRERRPEISTNGYFVSMDGKILAAHPGYEHFTIGQRKGMKVGFGQRVFVVRIDPETKNVVLGSHEDLAVHSLIAGELNWIGEFGEEIPLEKGFHCDVKIRYRNQPAPAEVFVRKDGTMKVKFDAPKYGVAPGQIAVCFQEDRVLGGGVILSTSSAIRE